MADGAAIAGEITVAEISTRLEWCLEHLAELTPAARMALLAVCSDTAGALERLAIAGELGDQASGPEISGP